MDRTTVILFGTMLAAFVAIAGIIGFASHHGLGESTVSGSTVVISQQQRAAINGTASY